MKILVVVSDDDGRKIDLTFPSNGFVKALLSTVESRFQEAHGKYEGHLTLQYIHI